MEMSLKWFSPLLLAVILSGCGGSSNGGDDKHDGGGAPSTSDFKKEATWTLTPDSNQSYCYDFDIPSDVDCDTSLTWDLKFQMGSRTPTLFTNSGSSGAGKGGALGGPFEYSWEQLQAFTGGLNDGKNTLVPQVYLTDSLDNAFAGTNSIGSAIFEYGLSGHLLFPNYRVMLVTTDNTKGYDPENVDTYAVQVVGYYGGDSGSTSGFPTIRWAKVGDAEGSERSETLDARAGWVYFDLSAGAVVDAPTSSNWHLAVSRYTLKTNGGVSGEGKVGSFVAATPEGFYEESGAPVSSAFLSEDAAADTLPLLFAEADWGKPANANGWKKDSVKSSLNPAHIVEVAPVGYPSPMQFNYGWYRYYSGIDGYLDHSVVAIPENGVMLRSEGGNSYARVHLTDISYADPESATSQTTWTFEFEIAPEK